jgi:hypothetical protein
VFAIAQLTGRRPLRLSKHRHFTEGRWKKPGRWNKHYKKSLLVFLLSFRQSYITTPVRYKVRMHAQEPASQSKC